MGILWSFTPQESYIDALEFPSKIKRDFDIREAKEKVEQLLRASVNSYRLGGVAPPLVAAYYLGASPQELTQLYEAWVPRLCAPWPEDDPVADSIGKFNLEEWFGQERYEQRYYEYFRDCLTEASDWPAVAADHMDQLWHRLCHNGLRPLVELAAGVEMGNGMIVSEALAMACTDSPGPLAVKKQTLERDGSHLALRFRRLAQRALKAQSYTAVVGVQACAEIFLKRGLNLLNEQRELAILAVLEQYLEALPEPHGDPSDRLREVSPAEALASADPRLVTYTRSRIVLQYLAT